MTVVIAMRIRWLGVLYFVPLIHLNSPLQFHGVYRQPVLLVDQSVGDLEVVRDEHQLSVVLVEHDVVGFGNDEVPVALF